MFKPIVFRYLFFVVVLAVILSPCGGKGEEGIGQSSDDTAIAVVKITQTRPGKKSIAPQAVRGGEIVSETIAPDSIVAFARTLIGVPYLYASTDPALGFDCSGFITYVFNHFGLAVPRSSVDFTNYGRPITEENARPGDLILFTGTDSAIRVVGHMGILESIQNDSLYFIHSTSGKMKGVVITPMGNYYRKRFVKVIRVFPDSWFQ